jgi:peroxiredoxin
LAIAHKNDDLMKKILKLVLLLIFAHTASAQLEPNDCVNALVVCGNGTFYSNATGVGNIQEINGCGGFEHNSLWLKINIVQGGTLGFNLIPDDPSPTVDYDFWVFGANATCGALGSPIRCNTINPQLAGTTTITGMNGVLATQAGPGAGTSPNNTGYVRWLTVLPGQSYYIAIDRPVGDGGFQLQWTGTAMAGTGAFPASPTANAIPDLLTCSSTPDVGIFNLDSVRSLINSNTTDNTISFHATIANAIDNINPLPNIHPNSPNPQTIYVRVTDNVSGCYTTTDFDLVVNLVPSASVSISSNAICLGDSATVTFTGTPNATFDYTIDAGPVQTAMLNATGTYTITESPVSDRVYKLTGVRMLDNFGVTICAQALNQTVSVTVTALPTVTISGTTAVCPGNTALITFTGTPNATVAYTVDGGTSQNIALNATGTATLTTPALTTGSTYTLVSATTAGAPGCSQTQTGSATITITAPPTASISGTTTLCSGGTAVITFSGTPNATVTYSVDGGTNQTIALNAAGTATLTTPILLSDSTYSLVTVSTGGTSGCSQAIAGSAIITVKAMPTATISGATTICPGGTTIITFSGTPNATVTYNVDGGTSQNIVLNATGTATVTTAALSTDTTYSLVSATASGIPACSQTLTGSVTITVNALATAAISGTTAVCPGGTAIITFSGTPNATVTYNVNGGTNQAIVLNATGTATITTAALSADTTYNLVSATAAGIPACSQNQSGSATITVNALPTVAISGTTTLCPGGTAVVTFTGTPNATVTYTVDGGTDQSIILNGSGTATLTTPPLTANSTYNLVSVALVGVSACNQTQTGSAMITVNASLTAAISGTTTICSGNTATISFNGTPNATVTYTVNGGTNQTIVLNGSGTATLLTPILTADSIYTLVSVSTGGASTCSTTMTGSATITVKTLPTAIISGTAAICPGNTATVTFSGTPNATIIYTVDGGTNQAIVLSGTGTATLTTPILTASSTYNLVSVTSAGAPVCSQAQAGSAIITVNALPTATISGTTTICSGSTALITFTGTPNAMVTYTVNGGANQNITLNGTGTASLTTSALTANRTYDLVTVTAAGTPGCSQAQSGSATVTVITRPTATIAGTASVCANSPLPNIVITGANGTAPYTLYIRDKWRNAANNHDRWQQQRNNTGHSNGFGQLCLFFDQCAGLGCRIMLTTSNRNSYSNDKSTAECDNDSERTVGVFEFRPDRDTKRIYRNFSIYFRLY